MGSEQRPPRHLTRRIYSYADADRIARVSRGTSKRWLHGYTSTRDGERVTLAPVTGRSGVLTEGVSFADLIEVIAISKLKSAGFSVRAIRKIVAASREAFNVPYPLMMLQFKTDGWDVFVEQNEMLQSVFRHRAQLAWESILRPFLETLDYRGPFVERWWPLGPGDRSIMVDPEYGHGLPVVAGSGVRTETILERSRAGDAPGEIAYDFGLTEAQVEAALRYELQPAA